MDLKMKGKTALVTGASEGIGKAIALAFAREGVDVAICARRKEPLEQTAAEIAKETGRKIVPIPADLTKPADAENFVKPRRTPRSAGSTFSSTMPAHRPGGVLEHLTEEHWAQSLQLKFMGYVRCMKHVLADHAVSREAAASSI
jgi:short-subunit dehydrogenase